MSVCVADDGGGALTLLHTLSQHGSTFDLIELEGLGKNTCPHTTLSKKVSSPLGMNVTSALQLC